MQIIASLSLIPGPDAVGKALAWLESVAKRHGWPQKSAFRLSLCMDEALSNIVMYGFRGKPEPGAISLAALKGPGLLGVDIVDDGIAFDPTLSVSPELASSVEEARIGGHGLRLMRHYLQDIQYRRESDRNHLRLILADAAEDG